MFREMIIRIYRNHESSHTGQSVSQLRFKPGTYRMKLKRVTTCVNISSFLVSVLVFCVMYYAYNDQPSYTLLIQTGLHFALFNIDIISVISSLNKHLKTIYLILGVYYSINHVSKYLYFSFIESLISMNFHWVETCFPYIICLILEVNLLIFFPSVTSPCFSKHELVMPREKTLWLSGPIFGEHNSFLPMWMRVRVTPCES